MKLINADALIKKIEQIDLYKNKQIGALGVVKALIEIENAPTIEERKKGEWIEQDDGWDGIYYECSVCKEPFTLIDGTPQDNLYNFCPNCGADMRGADG